MNSSIRLLVVPAFAAIPMKLIGCLLTPEQKVCRPANGIGLCCSGWIMDAAVARSATVATRGPLSAAALGYAARVMVLRVHSLLNNERRRGHERTHLRRPWRGVFQLGAVGGPELGLRRGTQPAKKEVRAERSRIPRPSRIEGCSPGPGRLGRLDVPQRLSHAGAIVSSASTVSSSTSSSSPSSGTSPAYTGLPVAFSISASRRFWRSAMNASKSSLRSSCGLTR